MRVFKYWIAREFSMVWKGERYAGRCYGGSDKSEQDAAGDAEQRWFGAVARIQGKGIARDNSYLADIREELLHEIDANNKVTRNRYGAEVLNSTDHCFLDIDTPPWSWRDLFGGRSAVEEKQRRIVEHVKNVFKTSSFQDGGMRIYKTPQGIRLLLTGLAHAPNSRGTWSLMELLHSDQLYMRLCRKQNCYRARLTPKPSRIGLKTPRCVWPRDAAADDQVRNWLMEYEAKRTGFAACHILETIGKFRQTDVVTYHDQRCQATMNLPLA